MTDKRMDPLALLSPGPEHAPGIGVLAGDLGVSKREAERLIAQLQALRFEVICEQERVWIARSGWARARDAAERHLAHDRA